MGAHPAEAEYVKSALGRCAHKHRHRTWNDRVRNKALVFNFSQFYIVSSFSDDHGLYDKFLMMSAFIATHQFLITYLYCKYCSINKKTNQRLVFCQS